MAAASQETDLTTSDLIEVRRSGVHGLGVFAAKPIAKGTRIIEYVGRARLARRSGSSLRGEGRERQPHVPVHRRQRRLSSMRARTATMRVSSITRAIPNCESTVEKKRVFIEATRDIAPGTELTYDYQIYREEGDPENIDEVFACRCGFPNCRGTMLWPPEPKKKRKAKKKAVAKSKGKAKGKSGPRRKSKRRPSAASRAQRQGDRQSRNRCGKTVASSGGQARAPVRSPAAASRGKSRRARRPARAAVQEEGQGSGRRG